jgi:ubiquinone/menaquinone biosynthesis C-methylase UbiE
MRVESAGCEEAKPPPDVRLVAERRLTGVSWKAINDPEDIHREIRSFGVYGMNDAVFSYSGYEIPIDLMNLTGGGPDTFGAISDQHIQHLRKHVGLYANQRIVEIGCGIGRDAIPLTRILGTAGHYIGVDVTMPSIEWCTANISSKFPNFEFHHFDINDPIYNPAGKMSIADYKIPVGDSSVDLIIAQSVFTHMFEDGIFHYLKEFQRILRASGNAYATCFVVSEDVRAALLHTRPTIFSLSFGFEYADSCFINLEENPTAAVAYTLPKLEQVILSAGLKFQTPLLRGNWSGLFPDADCGQDTLILGRV